MRKREGRSLRRRWIGLVLTGAATLIAAQVPVTSRAVTFGQLDDFQDGTTMNWSHGFNSPTPPSNVASGGPAGSGDRYLLNVSSGGFGGGSKQVMFNQVQWTGDYNAAGITRIRLNMANFGTTTLSMRIAVEGGSGGWYASSTPISLPPSSGWTSQLFDLTTSKMSPVGFNSDSLSTLLGNVFNVRILSNAQFVDFHGEVIAGQLGVDNIRALRLEGDANFDGVVDTLDFNALASNFGGTGKTWNQADFNFDGKVDTLDFNNLAANFGKTISSDGGSGTALVPEPVSLSAIALASLSLRRRRALRDHVQ